MQLHFGNYALLYFGDTNGMGTTSTPMTVTVDVFKNTCEKQDV